MPDSQPSISDLPPERRAAVLVLRNLLNEKQHPRRRENARPEDLDHVLRPIAALREVALVCESILGIRRGPGADDLRSLKDDVNQALTQMGKETKQALQPDVAEYLTTNKQVAELMDDPGGVQGLLSTARVMTERIRRPEVAQAMWRDLVGAVRTDKDDETCMLRLQQLREVQVNLGHSWTERAGELRTSVKGGDFQAGEKILGQQLEQTARVAWFIFGNADVPGDILRVGQTQFFSHRIWPKQVRDSSYFVGKSDAEFPSELDETWVGRLKPGDRSSEHVYARVELTGPRAADPRNPLAARRPPLAWARELVTSVVDAAMHASGGSRWILLEGGVAYHGTDENGQGLWDGVGGFLDPTDAQALDNFRPSQLEGTGNELQTLDLRLVDQLAAGDPRTIGAVDEARWHHSVRVQNNPAQRVALHVRAFEQALPIARGARWNDATQLYFQGFWAWDRFDGALQSAALSTRFWISVHDPQTAEQLITWADDEGVHLDRFVGAADQAHAALGRFQGDARITRRAVKQVSTWSKDPTLARLRLAKLASRFDILLARTVRQRNAIIHGVQTDPDVVASIDRFVARLAYYITAGALRSATVGEDLADGLERSRAQSNRMLWRLEQRTPLSKVWDDADIDEDAGPSGGEGHSTEDDGGGANDPDYADDAQGDPGPGVADD